MAVLCRFDLWPLSVAHPEAKAIIVNKSKRHFFKNTRLIALRINAGSQEVTHVAMTLFYGGQRTCFEEE